MPTIPNPENSTIPEPQLVVQSIIEETPDLSQALAASGVVQVGADGSVSMAGTTATLHAIGDYILNFQPAQNAFLNALINRIGFVIISSRMYTNPWSGFKKGKLEQGETIEEIFVNLCKPFQFSPSKAEEEVFKRTIPDVRAAFHTMNFTKMYPITVSQDQLRMAFLSWNNITDLTSKIIESVYASVQTDEFLVMKYMIARAIINGDMAGVKVATLTKANAVDIATTMNETAMTLEYQSTKFNLAGVTTHTPREKQHLICTAKFKSIMDMNVLAVAFNIDKAELMGNIIGVDSFVDTNWERLTYLFTDETGTVDPNFAEWTPAEKTILENVPAVVVGVEFWQVWDNLEKMGEIYNPMGLYWNYFYHVWKTFSISPFAQAAAYTTTEGSITSVSVTPTAVTLPTGSSTTIEATVVGTGVINKGVAWSMTGNTSTSSNVTDGLVVIAKDEEASSITVTATSIVDNTKKASSTITVS